MLLAVAASSSKCYVLFSAELKPRGYYLEHVFYLDHVIFTNMSRVFYLDQYIFIMSHEYYLDCVEFYLSHVLTKFLIVGRAQCITNQSRVYYLGQLFYSALKSSS